MDWAGLANRDKQAVVSIVAGMGSEIPENELYMLLSRVAHGSVENVWPKTVT